MNSTTHSPWAAYQEESFPSRRQNQLLYTQTEESKSGPVEESTHCLSYDYVCRETSCGRMCLWECMCVCVWVFTQSVHIRQASPEWSTPYCMASETSAHATTQTASQNTPRDKSQKPGRATPSTQQRKAGEYLSGTDCAVNHGSLSAVSFHSVPCSLPEGENVSWT